MTTYALLPDPASPLSRESAAQAFTDILDGTASDEAIEAFLIALSDRGQHITYSIAADNLANSLYSFLTPFCPDARKISAARKKGRRQGEGDET